MRLQRDANSTQNCLSRFAHVNYPLSLSLLIELWLFALAQFVLWFKSTIVEECPELQCSPIGVNPRMLSSSPLTRLLIGIKKILHRLRWMAAQYFPLMFRQQMSSMIRRRRMNICSGWAHCYPLIATIPLSSTKANPYRLTCLQLSRELWTRCLIFLQTSRNRCKYVNRCYFLISFILMLLCCAVLNGLRSQSWSISVTISQAGCVLNVLTTSDGSVILVIR